MPTQDSVWSNENYLTKNSCELHLKRSLNMSSLKYSAIFDAGTHEGRLLKDIPKRYYTIHETLHMNALNLKEGIQASIKKATVVSDMFSDDNL